MVADDNPDVLMAVADLITEFGGVDVVSLTTTVEDTVRSAAWHKPKVAFVDAWLKGGGAEAVAERIRRVSPGTQVVALASARDVELVLRLRAVGAAGCYDKETLSAVLPEILAAASAR
jgi:DNA-binding NarL/FixJ family response regulator